jgi:flavin-dependent dehydrogenase
MSSDSDTGARAGQTVLVIGGGPAGSTTAALLARAGYRVRLLERERFPRYHIGESIAPSCRAILQLSGAHDTVAAHGFQVKRGGLFRWGAEDWGVDWSGNFGPQVYSWQVDRADFDLLLLDNARAQGVEVIEGAAVKRVLFAADGERPIGVKWAPQALGPDQDGSMAAQTADCDFLVDASGRAGVMSTRHHKDRTPHRVFRNVAIWGYWKGARTLPGGPEGGLNAISSPNGWYWVIPLAGDVCSIGFVTHCEHFQARRPRYASLEDLLLAFVAESATVTDLTVGARFQPPVRVEQDYSYVAGRFAGPGHAIIGDAACFLDPLLSTGTHLAMYSALLAAAAITATLDGTVPESQALAFFEGRYRHAYQRFFKVVSLMYEQYQGKETYFWLAQRLVADGHRYRMPIGPFARIISGLSDLNDAGYNPSWAAMKRTTPTAVRTAAGGTAVDADRPSEHGVTITAITDAGTGLRLVTSPRIGLEPADRP